MTGEVIESIAKLRTESIQPSLRIFNQKPKALHCFVNEPCDRQIAALCCLGTYSPPWLFRHYALFVEKSSAGDSDIAAHLSAAGIVLKSSTTTTDVSDAVVNQNFALFEPYLPSDKTRRQRIMGLAASMAADLPDIVVGWCSSTNNLPDDFLWAAFISGVPSVAVYALQLAPKSSDSALLGEQPDLWAFLAKEEHISLCVDSFESAIRLSDALRMPLCAVRVLNDLLIQPGLPSVSRDAAHALRRYLAVPGHGEKLIAVSHRLLEHSLPRLVNALSKIAANEPAQCFMLGGGQTGSPSGCVDRCFGC
ncbi:hypothetical protein LJC46_01960 [Desulfovibrio sp. OttesenSCG-928-G15]|nr:hypothetical protein [Desulfovibrio sp. OttesenSCG-928-G15]